MELSWVYCYIVLSWAFHGAFMDFNGAAMVLPWQLYGFPGAFLVPS